MKKFLATISAIIYIVSSTGTTIQQHYCMGKLVSSDILRADIKKQKCTACGMTNRKGCCEDRQQVLRLDKQDGVKFSAFSIELIIIHKQKFRGEDQNRFNYVLSYHSPLDKSPPEKSRVPLYITNCIYRI